MAFSRALALLALLVSVLLVNEAADAAAIKGEKPSRDSELHAAS
jgi:hypothetical protein